MLEPAQRIVLQKAQAQFEQELYEHVLPFWLRYSPDRTNGGYFNCLDRDGSVYDSTKHVWLQGRQVWMFSKLYTSVEARPEWLDLARLGLDFLRRHAVRPDGRVYFSLTADGRPVYLQRKIFSECFYAMALAEYAHAADRPDLHHEARDQFERIWHWSEDLTRVGRPALEGVSSMQTLAIPMILLNLIEELAGEDLALHAAYEPQIADCLRRIQRHVQEGWVLEHVAPDGTRLEGSAGRLMNPGHAIEAGWFVQHWARRLERSDLQQVAVRMVRDTFARGWDHDQGGLYYFLDSEGFSPTQLEWNMKLWWPHTEALYAHLLTFSITEDPTDLEAFEQTRRYTFTHFPDPSYGEWFGYLDRNGTPTHRFKGGPYKGCFHVPRGLWLCLRLLDDLLT